MSQSSALPSLRQTTRTLLLGGLGSLAVFAAPVQAQVVINEIMQNPAAVSDANGEWFELYNSSSDPIDINGWTMRDDGSDSHVINNGGPLLVPAMGYLVLGNNADGATNGGVTVGYQYPSWFLSNSADEVVLLDSNAVEVDRVNYDGGPNFPDPTGASMALQSPELDNNVGSNWCESGNAFGGGDNGTPGAANDCGVVVPVLVITEIMQNPSAVSDGDGEWIEIYNPMSSPVDIDGWTIADLGTNTHTINNGGPLLVPNGGYLVIGTNTDGGTNGGAPVAYAYSSFFLGNSDDEVLLFDDLGNLVDQVEYDGGPDFPDPTGASMALRDPALDNNAGSNWCTSPNAFGAGDLGSPGFANDCALPTGGTLVINEVDYDQSGTDAAEFIELKNTGDETVNLAGFAVLIVNGSGGGASVSSTINLPSTDLAAGDYFVVCGQAEEVFGCDLDVSPNTNLIQNGSPDAVGLTFNGVLIDSLSYEGDTGAPYTEGSGSGLQDNGSVDFAGLSRFPDGADSNVNNVDFIFSCVTPGFANSNASELCDDPRPPALRINEVDYDQPGSDTAEFVEIINAGNSPAELLGVELLIVNGSGGGASVSTTIALPDIMLAPFDYFVVCANAANTANCDLDVSPDSNLIQNGAPDAVALVRGGLVLDAVSYEGDTGAPYTEGSGAGLEDSGASGQEFRGISRFPNGADSNVNNVDLVNACITPGFANSSLTSDCSADGPLLEIYAIQGSGASSPVTGQGVTTQANVVTAVGPEGFFAQTPDARADTDINTSNGIYVFTDSAPAVVVGDVVNVSGRVVEFFDFTEFAAGNTVTIIDSGAPLPSAVEFNENVPSPNPMAPSCAIELECYEGMLVNIANGTVTGPNQRFNSDILAEIHITAADSRSYREPGIEFPGLAGYPEWDGNPEVFELDADKLGLPGEPIAGGSSFSATGVIGFEFGGYELWPTSLTIDAAPLPVAVRSQESGEMTVAALNLFRLYDDIDDPGIEVRDPVTNELLRTTDDTVLSSEEVDRRLGKFSSYIRDVLGAPDILAVSEVEGIAVLQDLAARINADDNSLVYTAYLEEGNDIGGIDVGFLTRDSVTVDAVTQLGRFEILTFDNSLLNDRPPLLLEGRQTADGSDFPIAVIAIHGRSLSSIDSSDRVRQKRFEQARFVANEIQSLQDANPDINLVVAGDFNAFEFTDGYVDVTGQMKGDFTPGDNLVCETNPCLDAIEPDLLNQVLMIPAGERYSFIFRGNAQALDQVLTSSAMDELVRDLQFGRGNADAAADLINDAGTPLRSSDHDGLVLFVAKDSDGDGVTDDIDQCANTQIPEFVPTLRLGTNRWALTDDDREFDTRQSKGEGPGVTFDIFDTGGCSCTQIIDQLELGAGHVKYGCSIGAMEDWVELLGQP